MFSHFFFRLTSKSSVLRNSQYRWWYFRQGRLFTHPLGWRWHTKAEDPIKLQLHKISTLDTFFLEVETHKQSYNQMELVHTTALTLPQLNGLSCSSCRSLFFVNQKLFAANFRFQQSFYQNITHAYDHSQVSVVADGLCAMSCSSPIVWINLLYTESLLDANTIGHTLPCDALAWSGAEQLVWNMNRA